MTHLAAGCAQLGFVVEQLVDKSQRCPHRLLSLVQIDEKCNKMLQKLYH